MKLQLTKLELKAFVIAAALMLPLPGMCADQARPYSEGPVTVITSIKILPGGFDAYMDFVATTRKALMNEYKKAGLITDWHVYSAQARSPQEPDVLLSITYKNWAALDGLADRSEAIDRKVVGSQDKATAEGVSRGKIREVLGEETIQELVFK